MGRLISMVRERYSREVACNNSHFVIVFVAASLNHGQLAAGTLLPDSPAPGLAHRL